MSVLKTMRCPECGNNAPHRFHSCFHTFTSHDYWACLACGHRMYRCPQCREFTSRKGSTRCDGCAATRRAV